jgi:protease I
MFGRLLFLIPFFLIGCKDEAKKMSPIKKKVVIIVASSNFRDEEYLEPKKVLEDAGCKIKVASSSLNVSKGYFIGTEVKPDILIDDLKVDGFDAIIFVGGSGASEYFNRLSAHKVATEAVEKEKVLAAICSAPSILANAGILHGKRATSYSCEKNNLVKSGATFTQTDVVVDGRIITASGPDAAKKFGEAILKILRESE